MRNNKSYKVYACYMRLKAKNRGPKAYIKSMLTPARKLAEGYEAERLAALGWKRYDI